jgi:hypothetical protein
VAGGAVRFRGVRLVVAALGLLAALFLFGHRARIVELAAGHRLPTMHHQGAYVAGSGGLVSRGADVHDPFRRAGGHVDRPLRGGQPVDRPIEQPTELALVIDLGTAGSRGPGVPRSLLPRADPIVERDAGTAGPARTGYPGGTARAR